MRRWRVPDGLLIDDADLHLLGAYTWYLDRDGYVRRSLHGEKSTSAFLHRQIMSAKRTELVDHINGNRCDNRRLNLRIVTAAQSSQNGFPRRPRSGVRNVHWNSAAQKWQVNVKCGYRSYYFGLYESVEEAAVVAKRAALELFPFLKTGCIDAWSPPV